MKKVNFTQILLLFIFLLSVLFLIYILYERINLQPEKKFFQGPGEFYFYALNDGQPINFDPFLFNLDITTVVNDGYIYYFFPTNTWGTVLGRYDSINNLLEVFTERGFSSDEEALPKSFSLGESASSIKVFSHEQDKLFGIYRSVPKTLATILDVHGEPRQFIFDEDFLKWDGGTSYTYHDSIPMVSAWWPIVADLAKNDNADYVAVSTYNTLDDIKKITFLKYFPTEQTSSWKLWNDNGWVNWHSRLEEYVRIPDNNSPKDENYYFPQIIFVSALNKYFMIYYEETYSKLCAALYNDATQSWSWWTDNGWTTQSGTRCSDISAGNADEFRLKYILQQGAGASVIFDNLNGDIFEVMYDDSQQRWSITTLFYGDSFQSVTYVAKQDNLGNIWLFYVYDGHVYIRKKENGVWTLPSEVIYPTINSIALKELVFLSDNTPILFAGDGNSGLIYALANREMPSSAMRWRAPDRENIIDNNIINLENVWSNRMSSNYYPLGFPAGHLTADNEGNIYAPITKVAYVNIHTQETDDETDGHFWGGFWDYFFFPSGIEVDDLRNKVYVTDKLVGGGTGGDYNHGRLQIFDRSLYNTDLWFNYHSGLPSENPPPVVNPMSITSLHFPIDVAIDEQRGYLYVSEATGQRIAKYNITDSNVLPVLIDYIINGGNAQESLAYPQGIDVDTNGNLYVADAIKHKIIVFDSNGNFVRAFGNYGKNLGELIYPFGLAVDPMYNIVYVADTGNDAILLFTKTGEFLYGWNNYSQNGLDYTGIDGGIASPSGGELVVSVKPHNLARFGIADTTDLNANALPDIFERCGNGLIENGETCDDANLNSYDGCFSCNIEVGWICNSEPSVCTPICGDGLIRGSEQCDDSNRDNGDGCSSICSTEGDNGGSNGGSPRIRQECNDGIDNDNDGRIDYPLDSDCTTRNDNSESNFNYCTPEWQCGAWSGCIDGMQRRTCADVNECSAITGRPLEVRSCQLLVGDFNLTGNQSYIDEPGEPVGGVRKFFSTPLIISTMLLLVSTIVIIISIVLSIKQRGKYLEQNKY